MGVLKKQNQRKQNDDRTMGKLTDGGIDVTPTSLGKEAIDDEFLTSASRVNTEAVEEVQGNGVITAWADPTDSEVDRITRHQGNTVQGNCIQGNTIDISKEQSAETESHPFYTKLEWAFVILGPVMSGLDIGTDVLMALLYFKSGSYSWANLTLVFALAGLVGTQVFSYAWYRDDVKSNPPPERTISGISKNTLVALHIFGLGIFTRYHQLIKTARREKREDHARLVTMAADLSMLVMMEAFLEGAPQVLLQLYFVLGHSAGPSITTIRNVCMAFSFCNLTLALVNCQCLLRRSVPQINEMARISTVVYVLYKFSTITSHILSYCLLLILSTYSLVGLAFIWLLGTLWAHLLQTKFCSGPRLEWLYRAIVGVVLTFSFFNAKGQQSQRTKISITVYYVLYSILNLASPILLAVIKPEVQTMKYFLPVSCAIFGGTVFGLVCLCVYYTALHPTQRREESDDRRTKFIQP